MLTIESGHGSRRPPRPVGTGGGCGDGWGPCACPGGHTLRWDAVTPTERTRARTGTRPPHPPNPAPLSLQNVGPQASRWSHYSIRSATFIRAAPLLRASLILG